MKIVDRQPILNPNDEGMRRLVHEHLKVFVKFTSENCATCELLAPLFAELANQDEFQLIRFLRLNSDENPVAKKMMQERVAPFFAAYCQGRILECDSLTEKQEVLAMLHRLRAFKPLAL